MKNNSYKENLFFCSWALAVIATAGSLYFSNVLGFIPCDLCWMQRILMYPLVIILGIAVIRKDYRQSLYVLVLSLIGAGIAAYQYWIQKSPGGLQVDSCGIVPCTTEYINVFGFITIPFLSLVAFIAIFIISMIVWKLDKGEK